MTTPAASQPCSQPGCTGTIEDGYCNVCGSPAGAPAPTVPPGTPAPTAQATAPWAPPAPDSQRSSTRTSSSRLASTAIGSARTAGATRRLGTISTRLRAPRLGAGLTTVPPTPITDPLEAVLADPQVAEEKRYCPHCGAKVGRSRGDQPGRISGFCPSCGQQFDFSPSLVPGQIVGGQYEVVGAIAHGGLGWIYLARDRNVSGRFVVLKGLLNSGDKDALEAAIAEREFLAEVEHPLIVEIYNFVTVGAGEEADGYTVMEYVGGQSIKQILKERNTKAGRVDPLPVDQALAYILEILPAFSYLHDRGLLYCDFKPDNMIQQGESMKLIDLGGVRRITDQTSAIYGTIGYQAPEVPTEGPSIASDIYTIGRTLATMVLDFRGNTSTYVASLPPVADTPVFAEHDSFYRLLAKACAPAATDRFASVDEMRSQLLGVLRDVVAAGQAADAPPLASAASPHFEAPRFDAIDEPLSWNELPELKVDPGDPMAQWLAGVTDPVGRIQALSGAGKETREVALARIHAAIDVGQTDRALSGVQELLAEDPWEWRALWLQGLALLAVDQPVEARSAFNAVYGQVPGELAPKLALAAACERSDEFAVAEQLYLTCSRTDANYTAPCAFALARLRARRGDMTGVVAALDLVPPTRATYALARARRAGVLLGSASSLSGTAEALESIAGVPVDDRTRLDLQIGAYSTALAQVLGSGPSSVQVGGVLAREKPLRTALEQSFRERAKLAELASERFDLVDRANAVRPRTLT